MNQAYNNPSPASLLSANPTISLAPSSGPHGQNLASAWASSPGSVGQAGSDEYLRTVPHLSDDEIGATFAEPSATPSLSSPFTNPGTPVFTPVQRASSVIAHAPSSNSSSDSLAPPSPQKPPYQRLGDELWGHTTSVMYGNYPMDSPGDLKHDDNSLHHSHQQVRGSFGTVALPCLGDQHGGFNPASTNHSQPVKHEPAFFGAGTSGFSPSTFVHPNYPLFPTGARFSCGDNNSSGSMQDPTFAQPNFSELLTPIGAFQHPQFLSPTMPSHNQQQFINHLATFNGKTSMKSRGGRRPKEDECGIDPQDAEKRRLRRIRNKEAAARCRQRRIDLMNELQNQVHNLEGELEGKKEEIERLKEEKGRLECVLKNHFNSTQCKIGGINGFPTTTSSAPMNKQKKYEMGSLSFRAPKIDPDQTLTQVVTESIGTENTKMDLSLPHTSIAPTSLGLSGALDRPISLNLGSGLTPTTPSGNIFGDLMGLPTGLTPVNSTGYTPHFGSTSIGLSLETPTTSMDTESGIVNVKTSLCQL